MSLLNVEYCFVEPEHVVGNIQKYECATKYVINIKLVNAFL